MMTVTIYADVIKIDCYAVNCVYVICIMRSLKEEYHAEGIRYVILPVKAFHGVPRKVLEWH